MEQLSPEQLIIEKQKLDLLRQELEEKNKQMWAMSETVYKEKKKMEEQLKEILQEKSGLETQKKQNEETEINSQFKIRNSQCLIYL